MSGTFTHRVNRSWDMSQPNISAGVFFWEWLHYINDHAGMSFIGYGTGKTQSGTTPPASWLDWNPTTTPTPPFSDNSWFVFNADNADPLLDGGGSKQWQAKIQMTLATAFDDCNVADTDYDWEATTYSVVMRASATGGWDSTPLDFAPGGGEEASLNFSLFNGLNKMFVLDIIGDDDTLFWRGSAFITTVSNAPARSRGGYLGMLQRRAGFISNPFFFTAGRLEDIASGTKYRALNWCYTNNNYQYQWQLGGAEFGDENGNDGKWPSYSLWHDGTAVTNHKHDTWDANNLPRLTPDNVTGEDVVLGIKVAQWKPPVKYTVLGEFRLIAKTAYQFGHSQLFGSNSEWLQFCYEGDANSGIGMMWPQGETPIW